MTQETEKKATGRTLHEFVLYPKHTPRRPTALFLRNRKKMIVTQDRPCLICGIRASDLKDPARRSDKSVNRWGAKQMEAHHWIIEEALCNAIDLEKFNAHLRHTLHFKSADKSKYAHDFSQEQMEAWIHGDEDNLKILCDVHHRGLLVGIHSITFSIWRAQNLIFDNHDLTGFHAYSEAEAVQLTSLPVTCGEAKAPTRRRRKRA